MKSVVLCFFFEQIMRWGWTKWLFVWGLEKRSKYPRRPICGPFFLGRRTGVILRIAAACVFLAAKVLSQPFFGVPKLSLFFLIWENGFLKQNQALRRPWVAVVILSAGALCQISEGIRVVVSCCKYTFVYKHIYIYIHIHVYIGDVYTHIWAVFSQEPLGHPDWTHWHLFSEKPSAPRRLHWPWCWPPSWPSRAPMRTAASASAAAGARDLPQASADRRNPHRCSVGSLSGTLAAAPGVVNSRYKNQEVRLRPASYEIPFPLVDHIRKTPYIGGSHVLQSSSLGSGADSDSCGPRRHRECQIECQKERKNRCQIECYCR